MIAALEKQLPGSTLIIADSYKIVMDYVMDPGAYGKFVVTCITFSGLFGIVLLLPLLCYRE